MMSRMKALEEENRRLKKRYLEEKVNAEIVAEALKKSGEAISQTEMAKSAVEQRGITVKLAFEALRIIQDCYRYVAKGDSQNELIAQRLVALTDNNRNWGSGLCYLYLRNVKGFGWNHKRVYRIYRELELNLRIKPRTLLVREKPVELTVLDSVNRDWSMDFMQDPLEDGRSFRLLNVNDNFNREALGIEIDFSLPSERVIRVCASSSSGVGSRTRFAVTTDSSAQRDEHPLG